MTVCCRRTGGVVLFLLVFFVLLLPVYAGAKVVCSETQEQQTTPSGGKATQASSPYLAAASLAQGAGGVSATLNECTCKEVDDKGQTVKEFGLSCVIKIAPVPEQTAAAAYPFIAVAKAKVDPQCQPDRSVPKGMCRSTEDEVGKKRALGDLSINDFNTAVNQKRSEVGDLIQVANRGDPSRNPVTLLPEKTVSQGVGEAFGGGEAQQVNVAGRESVLGSRPTQQVSGNVGGQSNSPSTPAVAPSTPPAALPLSPATQIGNIANPGGPAPGSPANAGRPTFSPSPALSGSPFSLGSLFGGGDGSGGGYPGGPGGTIAYVPVNQYPGLTSPNFDTRGTGVTFPQPQPSPSDLLAYLAQNTKRQQGEKVTPGEFEDRSVVDSFVRTVLNNVVTPVGDFVRSAFSSNDVLLPFSGDEAGRSVVPEDVPPLERGRLVLTLSPSDTLVAGDPTELLVGRPDEEYETFESIPSSNRAWVQNAPRAADEIEGIGSVPLSYGWGQAPQSAGDAEVEAPQVSDASYNPFLLSGGLIPEIGGDEGASEPPRSFFSVMGRSFRTITDAIGNLFKNIGKALFWWL